MNLDDFIVRHRDRFEAELFDLLRIPSVSADPQCAGDVRRAADFVADHLRRAKLDVEVVATAGHPLVVAERIEGKDLPTLLIYGHYDVQPPDPLDLWVTGPFEPTVRNGNVYARGATDDKGQMFAHIKALEAWTQTVGKLPINVKVIIEGEEEVGSANIEHYVDAHRDRLRCDQIVISDCSMLAPDRPAITCGLRGIVYFEVFLEGPNRDLHSGSFGGSVQNPANAIAQLIASLKDSQGKIQVPGFYDDVVELSAGDRQQIKSLEDDSTYRKELGVDALFGEAGYSSLEHRWTRPTCDVNGLGSGYQGEGAKTVLPAKAFAKISFRLVPNQDPQKIVAAFEQHLRRHCPPGIRMQIKPHHGAPAVMTPTDSPGIRAAARALQRAYGVEPAFIREGGSIPIVSNFKQKLGADTLLIGFGLPDDNTHSPNEKFCLKDYHRGIRTSAYLFEELARSSC